METIYVKTEEEIDRLGSALTFRGLALSGIPDMLDWVRNLTPLKRELVYVTKGSVMNGIYGLTGDNAYPDDCNIVSVDLGDMEDWNAVVMPRFEVGGRWLDDIVDSNRLRKSA